MFASFNILHAWYIKNSTISPTVPCKATILLEPKITLEISICGLNQCRLKHSDPMTIDKYNCDIIAWKIKNGW